MKKLLACGTGLIVALGLSFSCEASAQMGLATPPRKMSGISPGSVGHLHYEDSEISMSAVPYGGLGGVDLHAVAADGRRATVRLPEGQGLLSDIKKVSNDLYLLSLTSVEPYSLELVFDPKTMTVREQILCYNPTLSPDRRYLAFGRFYPAHFAELPTSYSDAEVIYDFQKSVLANFDPRNLNRPHEGRQPGLLAFPLTWSPMPSAGSKPRSVVFTFPSYFVWSADSRYLLFMYTSSFVDDDYKDPHPSVMGPSYRDVFGWALIDLVSGKPEPRVKIVQTCVGNNRDACNASMLMGRVSDRGVDVTYEQARIPESAHYNLAEFVPLRDERMTR